MERTGAAALNPANGATVMKPSTKNKVQGKFHEMKGKVRAKAGELTNDPGLQAKGIVEEASGQVQGMLGHVEKTLEKPRCRQ